MKRDLHADLLLCESVRGVYYDEGGGYRADYPDESYSRHYFEEADEGWPVALRRAIIAEAEVERLRAALAQIATYGGIDMRGATCAQAAKDALNSTPPVYDDVTESHRWLKALVSALDDGRIQQTRLSSGTDYVVQSAREWVRKLDSEVSADVY
ncbi:hypothetical protein [Paenibacillus xylanexedens]|uniref:hypothetical protein n=1 Tax=Paenibacillus xylanexedens TaxID=528191 RepID=UPI00119D83AB|nr:hypothetical protein [Paenibacillus xylanexedens]